MSEDGRLPTHPSYTAPPVASPATEICSAPLRGVPQISICQVARGHAQIMRLFHTSAKSGRSCIAGHTFEKSTYPPPEFSPRRGLVL